MRNRIDQLFSRNRRLLPATGLAVAAVVALPLWLLGRHGGQPVDFNQEVRPILQRCTVCHGGVKRAGGLSLLFREDALADSATESGRAGIVPGDPEGSEVMRRVRHHDPEERMPLDAPPLSEEEVGVLRRWIQQGASWEPHWAYVPPEPVPLPDVEDTAWVQSGIDRFILARLEQEGLAPSPRADCAVLLRRVSLDLVGLPPDPAEVEAFCSDPSPQAYAQAVDGLLASPHFGERWATMWLDLARYADSQGYEKDKHRTIWRYRDWVIQAFNRDMPFDRFTIEQLAGDLLPEAAEEHLVATAFHRNTMTNDEGGTDDEEFRVAAVIDRVNTTWEVWQGTTMACVQCHNHPYDPFRQEEYYRLFAFFNNTEDADRPDERPVYTSFEAAHEPAGRPLVAELEALEQQMYAWAETPEGVAERRAWEGRLRDTLAVMPLPSTFEGRLLPRYLLRIVRIPEAERAPYERRQIVRYFTSVAPGAADLRERYRAREQELRKLEPVRTPILQELPPEDRRKTHVFERGNWMVKGQEVQPDVPGALPPLPAEALRNRLGLARWLVSPENPLTARVTVNRFWEQLFGAGLVETLEDFGTQGTPPTHPELLDWLALQFVHEHGWSVKRLLREVVTSATYQQSARVTPELLAADPYNRLLARYPRVRLTAEQVRDQALKASGLLSEKMLGPSVMPPQPEGIWMRPYSSEKWQVSEGEDRYRRALYTYWRRTAPYPSMVTFDAPSREFCVSRRVRTSTPLQALVTLNDPVYVEAAQALARRMAEAGGTVEGRLAEGYRRALLRAPSAEVLQVLRGLYEDALQHYRAEPEAGVVLAGADTPRAAGDTTRTAEEAALAVVANAILNLDAFITKE